MSPKLIKTTDNDDEPIGQLRNASTLEKKNTSGRKNYPEPGRKQGIGKFQKKDTGCECCIIQ